MSYTILVDPLIASRRLEATNTECEKSAIRFLRGLAFVDDFPQFVERRPCEFCKPPCGNFGEGVAFADGIHYVCPKGIERWNAKHQKKIISHGS
jgi:hypothetical protein